MTTRWSVVLEAGAQSGAALEDLCRSYWYPVYSFIRRRGIDEHRAKDLTQEFFATLLSGGGLQRVSPEAGRFRSFILAAVRNTLANDWRDAHRQKRGGGREILSWDGLEAEERYRNEPEGVAPEALFDVTWAQSVACAALQNLEREMRREGVGDRYDVLKVFLQGDGRSLSYEEASQRLGLSLAAVKAAIYRIRRHYGELLRREVAATVGPDGDVDEEVGHLIRALSL
jgi:RNA polymerase sigma-70 factor (ECF subfamily)